MNHAADTGADLARAVARDLGVEVAPVPLRGGRTNRVWRAGDYVIKQFVSDGATPLFPNNAALEWRALQVLEGTGLAPEPVAWRDEGTGGAVVWRYVDGAPPHDVAAVARTLRRLHGQPVPEWMPQAAVCDGVMAAGLEMAKGASALLEIRPPAPLPADPVFLHRDPIPANIAGRAVAPVLIDWQCPGRGDAVEDVAHYISPAMRAVYGDAALARHEIARFLEAYGDDMAARYARSGPAYHWRMAAYCAWQAARGVTAYGAALEAELAHLRALTAHHAAAS